jgi:hypothetical protein
VRALVAGWRLSLHRTRADWPIVAAAWLITTLAAVLLSIGPIYSSAAATAGLHKALEAAPSADTDVEVSLYASRQQTAGADVRVRGELASAIQPLGGEIVRDFRSTESFALGGPTTGGATTDGSHQRAILGSLDRLAEHATLRAGAWPADRVGSSAPIQVVVLDSVARALHLSPGSAVSLVSRGFDQIITIDARVVGVFGPDRVNDPYWHGDALLTGGVELDGQDRTFGPFLTTPRDLLQSAGVESVHARWEAFPDLERLTLDDSAPLRGRLADLPGREQVIAGDDVVVTTGLPVILAGVERSLLVARASVLLMMVQLAILAAYAIILTASLLVEHRRITTALLRSRGAGPGQVALLSFAEGLLLAVPAVVVAPWVAVGALNLLTFAGPLADASVIIAPRVTLDAYLAAGAAGIVSVALLAIPALLAARAFAAEHRELSRQETRTFGQRMGLDIALLAVAAIALWQLRLYGATLTRTVQGSLGLDPLLVAAPAIGLLAGGILALRILPLLAHVVETAVSRGRHLVAPLGFRQLARRPLRYTRSALLLMIAMATGVFALAYGSTWSASQHDQAMYQVGADVRVRPGVTGPPQWAMPRAYAGVASIASLTPVERIENGVSIASGTADLLAVDADRASSIVLLRPDAADRPLDEMAGALRDGRPAVPFATLPARTAYLRVTPRLDIGSISQFTFEPGTGATQPHPLDPATLDIRVSVTTFVQDVHGLVERATSNELPVGRPAMPIVVPLAPTEGITAPLSARLAEGLDGPVKLVGLQVDLRLPLDTTLTRGFVGVAEVAASAGRAGAWSIVPLTPAGPWAARLAQGNPLEVPADESHGVAMPFTGQASGGRDVLFGNGPGGEPAHLTFLPQALATLDKPVPAIADRAFLASTHSAAGGVVLAGIDGALRNISIVGVVDGFPTTDPKQPLLVLDEPTLGLLRLQATSDAKAVDEWWMSVPDRSVPSLTAALRATPFESLEVASVVERARTLSTDPVALGIIAALTFGFVATALFAIVGLSVSAAVSASQRRTEFALLRALGLSARQLAAWLWLENGSLVLVSLLAGTLLGVFIGWLVLPFVTVTQQATAPVPSVLVDVPWMSILLLDLVSLVALAVAVIVIGTGLRRVGVGSILRMGED